VTIPAIPAGRIQLDQLAMKPLAAMLRLEAAIGLDPAVRDLIKLRASQINGCATCIDMHWKDARADGESEERLYSLDAWRESPLYSDRERAALELCEAMTLITDGHVPDAVWEAADDQFGDEELAQLVFSITAINAWNRLMITARVEPGHYQPGMAREMAAAVR
jgi:AhpD family alkylhydroperoxidase